MQDTTDDIAATVVAVKRTLIHPKSIDTYIMPQALQNNVALVELSTKLNFSSFIRPVCLPSPSADPDEHSGQLVTIAWWGAPDNQADNFGVRMESTLLEIYSNAACNKIYTSDEEDEAFLSSEMMCAGLHRPHNGPCNGDSGSPLVKWAPDLANSAAHYFLYGILVGGIGGCDNAQFPSVFTRISEQGILRFIADKTVGYYN